MKNVRFLAVFLVAISLSLTVGCGQQKRGPLKIRTGKISKTDIMKKAQMGKMELQKTGHTTQLQTQSEFHFIHLIDDDKEAALAETASEETVLGRALAKSLEGFRLEDNGILSFSDLENKKLIELKADGDQLKSEDGLFRATVVACEAPCVEGRDFTIALEKGPELDKELIELLYREDEAVLKSLRSATDEDKSVEAITELLKKAKVSLRSFVVTSYGSANFEILFSDENDNELVLEMPLVQVNEGDRIEAQVTDLLEAGEASVKKAFLIQNDGKGRIFLELVLKEGQTIEIGLQVTPVFLEK